MKEAGSGRGKTEAGKIKTSKKKNQEAEAQLAGSKLFCFWIHPRKAAVSTAAVVLRVFTFSCTDWRMSRLQPA